MKVSCVSNIIFSGTNPLKRQEFVPNTVVNDDKKDVKTTANGVMRSDKSGVEKFGYVTPDFNIKVPTRYRKTSVDKLDNGLEMHSYKMANGYKVTIVPMKNSPAVVKSYVNVGSMNETSDIKGISHFLEHMAFNGTNGEDGHIELKQGDSFKQIDKLGGWANASTNYAITDYVNSTPQLDDKDLETQIKVIAAMAEDLKLSDDMIAKEKGPVSSEINMILDNPQTVAMDQTVRTLFNVKNPADELVGGSVSHIQNLTREDVVNYYNKYYTPDNTNIVVTGDVDPEEVMHLIAKNFNSTKVSKGHKFEEKLEPIQKAVRKDFSTDKATSAEMVIGFAGPKNSDTRGKILLDLALAYVNSHEAGLVPKLKKYNSYPIIGTEKISTNPNSERIVYMSISPADYNSEEVLKAVFDKLGHKRLISYETTQRLKQKIKQENDSVLEHSTSVNDCIGQSVLDNDLEYVTKYNEILDSITPEELSDAVQKYFDVSKSAITIVHPNKKINSDLSFKGKSENRLPMDLNDVSEYILPNNFDVAFYNTKTNNINVSMNLKNNVPYSKKAGVVEVLNELYTMGTANMPVDVFNEFKDKNNLRISVDARQDGITIGMSGDVNNYKLGMESMKELLFNPNITEENIKTAVERVKDRMVRTQISANILQHDVDTYINPMLFSRDEVLNGLDKVTVDDVKELYNYLIKNSRAYVAANVPQKNENEIKNDILLNLNSYPRVEQNNFRLLEVHKDIKKPAIVKVANHNSQADISEVFRFKRDNSIKERAALKVMNSILSSSSIGLFDVLREKENLAYSVFSDYSALGDQGQLSLNILTTTDNKDIGEYSYDNVEKSIVGFNRQIQELLDGKFTDEDLDIAKRSIKAGLLNNEGNFVKLEALQGGLNSPYNLDLKNKLYEEVDKLTKEDIIDIAQKVFSNNPIYAVVASKDTLDANKDFFDSLKG